MMDAQVKELIESILSVQGDPSALAELLDTVYGALQYGDTDLQDITELIDGEYDCVGEEEEEEDAE